MYTYSFSQWMLFFYIYCFFGWIFESTYVSLKKRRFVNRGFLNGPAIPIYGEGAIMMLFVTLPFKGNYVLEYCLGLIGATALEFVVGALMEQVFKVKYWDYSNQPFNFKGYICLSSSLCWGLLSVLLAEIIHEPISVLVTGLSSTVVLILSSVITIIFAVDAFISAKEAWDLRVILIAITKAKEEMQEFEEKLNQKLEETKEVIGDKLEGTKEAIGEKLEESREAFEEKMIEKKEAWEEKKESFEEKIEGTKDAISDRLEETKGALEIRKEALVASERYNELVNKLNGSKNLILRRNPGATSRSLSEALDNLKENMGLNKK